MSCARVVTVERIHHVGSLVCIILMLSSPLLMQLEITIYDSAAIRGKIIIMFCACAARARVCSLCVCI